MAKIKGMAVFGKRKVRKCTITLTPESDNKMDVVGSNDFSSVEIFDLLSSLQKHFAKVVTDEYVIATHDNKIDDAKFDAWLNRKRKL